MATLGQRKGFAVVIAERVERLGGAAKEIGRNLGLPSQPRMRSAGGEQITRGLCPTHAAAEEHGLLPDHQRHVLSLLYHPGNRDRGEERHRAGGTSVSDASAASSRTRASSKSPRFIAIIAHRCSADVRRAGRWRRGRDGIRAELRGIGPVAGEEHQRGLLMPGQRKIALAAEQSLDLGRYTAQRAAFATAYMHDRLPV